MAAKANVESIRAEILSLLRDELTIDVTCDHEQGSFGEARIKVKVKIGLRSLGATIAESHDSFGLGVQS